MTEIVSKNPIKGKIIKSIYEEEWGKNEESLSDKEYVECVEDILQNRLFQSMNQYLHGGMDPTDSGSLTRADRLVSRNGNLATLSPSVRGIYWKSEQNNTYCIATRPAGTVRTNPHRRKHLQENPRHRKQENRLERSRQKAFPPESRLIEPIGRGSELSIVCGSCDTWFRSSCRGYKPAKTEWGAYPLFTLTHYENIDGQHCSY